MQNGIVFIYNTVSELVSLEFSTDTQKLLELFKIDAEMLMAIQLTPTLKT